MSHLTDEDIMNGLLAEIRDLLVAMNQRAETEHQQNGLRERGASLASRGIGEELKAGIRELLAMLQSLEARVLQRENEARVGDERLAQLERVVGEQLEKFANPLMEWKPKLPEE